MPSDSEPQDPQDELQFETVEEIDSNESEPAVQTQACAACRQPITATYYAVRDKLICPNCHARLTAKPPGPRAGRVVKAGLMGLGAGLVGALIWFVIRRVAHVEIGLVAVLVGFMVGKAVRKGSGDRGGRGYQVMAVVLTYCCIAANYMPDVVEAFVDMAHRHHRTEARDKVSGDASAATQPATQAADQTNRPPAHPSKKPGIGKAIVAAVLLVALVFGVALAAPFLGGAQSLIGLLIIGFALWEAWKFNRPRALAITGPYQVGPSAGGQYS
jgi:predicted lipid-binding transport protein (Tim44 family)